MGGLGDGPPGLLRGGPRGNRSKIRCRQRPNSSELKKKTKKVCGLLIGGPRGSRSEQGQGWGMGGLGDGPLRLFDCRKALNP